MMDLMTGRRERFSKQCLTYLRYVLNDHFLLFLLVFFGFLALQYRQLLVDLPTNPWPLYVILLLVTGLVQLGGQLGSYLEEADQVFLLPKEGELLGWLATAKWRMILLWGTVQTGLQLVLLPLYRVLGLPFWGWLLLVGFLWLLRVYQSDQRLKTYLPKGQLDWAALIQAEQRRQQGILRFFALFTRVKGISTAIKERSYLNVLLARGKRSQRQTWDYLYLRAFLRSGEFFPLTLRLLGLIGLVSVGVEEDWLAIGLSFLLHYLLLFQLLGLYGIFDYQYLTGLYPVSKDLRQAGFRRVLLTISAPICLLQLILSLVFLEDKTYAFYLVLLLIGLHSLYLPIKIKKLID